MRMEKRYDGILLCSDFDRTLASNKHGEHSGELIDAVPKNNIDAIKRFVNGGGTFVMVSGRNPDEMISLAPHIPMHDLFVCSNGTAVYSVSKNKSVVDYVMGEECIAALEYFAPLADEYTYFRITDLNFNFRFFKKGDDFDAVVRSAQFPVHKIIVEHSVPELTHKHYAAAQKLFGDKFIVETSSDYTLELCPKGSGKGPAIKAMLPLMEKRFEKVVCVGDNNNDVSMIEFADLGVAVGNSIERLKSVADLVTVDASEGAIAAVIELL